MQKKIVTIFCAIMLLIFSTSSSKATEECFETVSRSVFKFNLVFDDIILEPLAIIISSFAPHIAEEIWQQLGNTHSITSCNYPDYDEKYLHDSTKIYPVSINGKLKYKIELPTNLSKEEIEKEILADKVFIKKLNGQKPKRVIVVPGKIINFVL